jgi:hypothetical protein
MKFITPN